MNLPRWLRTRRAAMVSAVAFIAALAGVVPAAASDRMQPAADPGPSVQIIGGRDASQQYRPTAALYIPWPGGRTAFCTGVLLYQHVVATGAHCVTEDFQTTPINPKGMVVRVKSNDRTSGGEAATGVRIQVHPGWDWAMSDTPVDDLALIFLDRKLTTVPYRVAAATDGPTRIVGWGLTQFPPPAPGLAGLPRNLQELDTGALPLDACAWGFAGTGEVCVGHDGPSGACFGDSGGPALRATGSTWTVFGIASRGGTEENICGTTVYTDLRYYERWIAQQVFSKVDPPTPCACDPTAAPANRATVHSGPLTDRGRTSKLRWSDPVFLA